MPLLRPMRFFALLLLTVSMAGLGSVDGGLRAQENLFGDLCPEPMARRLQPHTVRPGETLTSIAQRYQLVPASITGVNPGLTNVTPGQTIFIPPFNGRFVPVPAGASWRDLANLYGVRADILFELNGCEASPRQAFVPGVANGAPPANVDNYTGLDQWPISPRPQIGLDYGWHAKNDGSGESFFHSGIDLIAPLDTPVQAAAPGEVILVSQEGAYGFLVVVDHGNNRQTRYAHLNRFAVSPGDRVNEGTVLGYVGVTGRPDISEPHVHFEVRFQSPVGWAAQDPKLHLPR